MTKPRALLLIPLIFALGCLPKCQEDEVPAPVLLQCVKVCAPYKAAPYTISGGWVCGCDVSVISPDLAATPAPRDMARDALYKGEY